jgi:hypothetical protein
MSYFIYDPRFRALGLGGRLDQVDVQALPANLQSVAEGNLDVVLSANLLALDSGNGNPITRDILTRALPPRVQIVGNAAYVSLADGNLNTFVGDNAGALQPAERNTFVGAFAGEASDASTSRSVFVGAEAGRGVVNALECVFVGSGAGKDSEFTTNVVALGSDAFATTGTINFSTDSVFIGKSAGQKPPFATNRLVVVGAHALSNAESATVGIDSVLVGANVCAHTSLDMANVVVIGSSAMEDASNLTIDSVVIGSHAAQTKTHATNASVIVGKSVLGNASGNTESTVVIGAFAMEQSIGNVEQSVVIGSRAGYHAGNVFSTTAIGHETLSRVTVDGSTVVGSRIMGDLPIALSNCMIVGEGLTVSPLVLPTYDTIKHIGGETRRVALTRASTRHDMSATFVCPIDEVYISVFGIPEPTVNEDGVSSGSIPSSSPFVDIVDGKMYLGGFGSASHEGIVIVHTSGNFYGFVDGIPIDPATGTTFQTGFVKPADGTVSIYGWTQGALPFATFDRQDLVMTPTLRQDEPDPNGLGATYTIRGDGTTFDFLFDSGVLRQFYGKGNVQYFPPRKRSFTIFPSPEALRRMRSRTSYAAVLAYPWYEPTTSNLYSTFIQYLQYFNGNIKWGGEADVSVSYFMHDITESDELAYPSGINDSILIGCNTSFPSPIQSTKLLPIIPYGSLYIGLGEYMLCKADQTTFNIYSTELRIKNATISKRLAIGDGYSIQYDTETGAVTSNVLSEHRFLLAANERLRVTSSGTIVYGKVGQTVAAHNDQYTNANECAMYIAMPQQAPFVEETMNVFGIGIEEYTGTADDPEDPKLLNTMNTLNVSATRDNSGIYTYKMRHKYQYPQFPGITIAGGFIEYGPDSLVFGLGEAYDPVRFLTQDGGPVMSLVRSSIDSPGQLAYVGIGTSTPQETLSVNGTCSITGTLSANTFSFTSDTASGMFLSNSGTALANGGEPMVVADTASNMVDVRVMPGPGTSGTLRIGRYGSVGRFHEIEGFNSSTAASNYLKFKVHNGTVGATTDVMTLDGRGYVGIGTTSPLAILHVLGSDANSSRVRAERTGGVPIVLASLNTVGIVATDNDSPLALWTSGTSRVTVAAAGDVGIGTTSPTQKLHVVGNIIATGSIDAGTSFYGRTGDSANAPSFSFTTDKNSGMYSVSGDEVGISTNGTGRVIVSNAGATIPNPGTLSFGSTTRQMLNLWGTAYALGVQNNALYLRSGGTQIYFYGGGVHNNTNGSAGTGGTLWGTVSSSGFSTAGSLTGGGASISGTGRMHVGRTPGNYKTRRRCRNEVGRDRNEACRNGNEVGDDGSELGCLANGFPRPENLGFRKKYVEKKNT